MQAMNRKFLLSLLYILPMLCILSILAFTTLRPIQVLPRVGLGPGFGFTDAAGARVTNETLRGKIVVYSFTYTHCQAGCPQVMAKMLEVWQRLGEVDLGQMEVELVTISIDPERDTPAVMAQYAAGLGLPAGFDDGQAAWRFLTGDDPRAVEIMVTTGFDLFYEKQPVQGGAPGDYGFDFVPMVVLIDGWGIIRAEYRQYEVSDRLSFSEGRTDIDPDIVLRDVGLVAAEANNSRGVASAAYGAAHLFLCYPP